MKGKILADLERELWPAITAGTIRPVIHAVLPVEHAADAHAILQSGKNTGKVVLTIGH